MTETLPLIPSSVIGSHGKPGWWFAAVKAGPWGYDQQQRYEAVGRVETPPTGFGLAKDFEFLNRHGAVLARKQLTGAR